MAQSLTVAEKVRRLASALAAVKTKIGSRAYLKGSTNLAPPLTVTEKVLLFGAAVYAARGPDHPGREDQDRLERLPQGFHEHGAVAHCTIDCNPLQDSTLPKVSPALQGVMGPTSSTLSVKRR